MKTEKGNPLLSRIPSWALALFTLFGSTVLTIVIGEGLGPYIKIDANTGEAIAYIINGIIIAICCYLIIRRNPESLWYVLLICNAFVILPALIEPNFWKSTSMWIPMCGGLVLSVITSIIGAWKGNRTAKI